MTIHEEWFSPSYQWVRNISLQVPNKYIWVNIVESFCTIQNYNVYVVRISAVIISFQSVQHHGYQGMCGTPQDVTYQSILVYPKP